MDLKKDNWGLIGGNARVNSDLFYLLPSTSGYLPPGSNNVFRDRLSPHPLVAHVVEFTKKNVRGGCGIA